MTKTFRLALASAALTATFAVSAFAQQQAQTPLTAQAAVQPAKTAAKAGTQAGKVFGQTYAPVAGVGQDQTQVVYYRPAAGAAPNAPANVYIDGHYHTTLLPNGFTVFCLAPGEHALASFLNDAPSYAGKQSGNYVTNPRGGTTYFLRVREDSSGAPVPVVRETAERELGGMREQMHALSRAPNVQACRYTETAQQPAVTYRDHTFSGDLLFSFGKSGYRDIHPEGREALHKLVSQINAADTRIKRITVIGHADQIGTDAAARDLGMKRAQTVQRVLAEEGLPADRIDSRSAGNTEPVVTDCAGGRQKLIACNAPNRRVVVRVDASKVT
ncbi:OmpA family protein [Burkholderia pyrrocinia]|uniref:OmpA family protein n=1 Tax=Burkholderia pyrrocinia TaxID=60550 RepID=UPI00104EF3C5|nr:OmpA family protein [Burkholderia pyrrocinia]TDA47475.1 flagellar motor protein MotB [Burkholderia pyrrocinia]